MFRVSLLRQSDDTQTNVYTLRNTTNFYKLWRTENIEKQTIEWHITNIQPSSRRNTSIFGVLEDGENKICDDILKWYVLNYATSNNKKYENISDTNYYSDLIIKDLNIKPFKFSIIESNFQLNKVNEFEFNGLYFIINGCNCSIGGISNDPINFIIQEFVNISYYNFNKLDTKNYRT